MSATGIEHFCFLFTVFLCLVNVKLRYQPDGASMTDKTVLFIGAMLATTALAITVSVLVGMLVFNNLYSATVFVWAPFTFVIMLGLLCFTILLAV